VYKVLDVTYFSFEGFPTETFDSLLEAFAYVGREIEDGSGNRYEIHEADGEEMYAIEIDARHSFADGGC
jgi:hypothetical protein